MKRKVVESAPLWLGIAKLEEVVCFKYLGVEFKNNLCWSLMRNRVIKQARSRLALISRAIVRGISPDASLICAVQ
jgi:hypothetical protein